MIYLFFIVTIIALISTQYLFYIERKDLINKIMAKNYVEYKAMETKPKAKVEDKKESEFTML
jgi:hypothetical protein